jgi:hypothetical protein
MTPRCVISSFSCEHMMAVTTRTYEGVAITMDLQYGYNDMDFADSVHGLIDSAIKRKGAPLKHRAIQCIVHLQGPCTFYHVTWCERDADTIRIDIRPGVDDSDSENIREDDLICTL